MAAAVAAMETARLSPRLAAIRRRDYGAEVVVKTTAWEHHIRTAPIAKFVALMRGLECGVLPCATCQFAAVCDAHEGCLLARGGSEPGPGNMSAP